MRVARLGFIVLLLLGTTACSNSDSQGPMATYPTVRTISAAQISASVTLDDGCVLGMTDDGVEFVPIFQADAVTYTADGLRADGDVVGFGTTAFMGGAPPTMGQEYVEPEADFYIPDACPKLPLVPVFGLSSTDPSAIN